MANPHETDESGVVVNKNPDADNQAGEPEEAQAVTGRPNDLKITDQKPALENSSFAARRKAREAAEKKAVSSTEAENKAVASAETKSGGRKRS